MIGFSRILKIQILLGRYTMPILTVHLPIDFLL